MFNIIPIILVVAIMAICVVILVILKDRRANEIYQNMVWGLIAVCFVSNIFLNVEYVAKHEKAQKEEATSRQMQSREVSSL